MGFASLLCDYLMKFCIKDRKDISKMKAEHYYYDDEDSEQEEFLRGGNDI